MYVIWVSTVTQRNTLGILQVPCLLMGEGILAPSLLKGCSTMRSVSCYWAINKTPQNSGPTPSLESFRAHILLRFSGLRRGDGRETDSMLNDTLCIIIRAYFKILRKLRGNNCGSSYL